MTRRLLPLLALLALPLWAAEPFAGASCEQLLIRALEPGDTPEHSRLKVSAHDELMRRGGESLRCLMERVDSENVMVPVLAQELVDQLPGSNAVPVLATFIESPSTNIARLAVFYLGFYHAPELAPRILPLLAQDRLRGVAVRALGKWQVTNALDAVAGALCDTNERVRVAAANALRDIGDPRALKPLAAALADPLFTVRNTALRAMLRYGAAAEPLLRECAQDPRPMARRQAIRGLAVCGAPRAEKDLQSARHDPDPGVREDAEAALVQFNARERTSP